MKPEDRIMPQSGGAYVIDKEGKLQPDTSETEAAVKGVAEPETKPVKEKR